MTYLILDSRWATIPVVKQAQIETVLDFPAELDVPWHYLQRNFGMSGESGNIAANVLLNFDQRGERVYQINVRMSDLIRTAEDIFFRMFLDVEVLVSAKKKKISCRLEFSGRN